MYTINNPIYCKHYSSIEELIIDVINHGIDPDQEILFDGEPTGENLSDYLDF